MQLNTSDLENPEAGHVMGQGEEDTREGIPNHNSEWEGNVLFNDTAPTEFYSLTLHVALPIGVATLILCN